MTDPQDLVLPDPVAPDRDLDADLRAFALRMRAFAAAKLAPHARRIDEEATFRRESVRELAAAGILGGPLGKAVGGGGWSPMQVALANEEIGAVCGNTRGFMAVQSGLVAYSLERFATPAQQARWLPRLIDGTAIGCFGLTEELAGSDVASLACCARPEGDGFAISGKKIWITNGGIADICVLFATVDPARGRDGITAFLVPTDRAGLTRTPMPGKELGHRGSDHAELTFAGLRVGKDDVLGGVGQGFKVAMTGLNAGRLSVAAGAVGIHRAALTAALAFTRQRQQFGKPIAAFQMVQERLADLCTELVAARGLVWRCAARRAAGTESPTDLAMAKLYATEAASRAADIALQLHGARGYSTAYPVERLLRDAAALRIYEGTSMIQKTIIARALTS
jgi:alkylation response protein AidB-like acyl-CoA dehydrogenase